jgi:serine/threonine protein kinase
MDDYQTTLRHRIGPNIQMTERQWFTIMLGIVDRLAFTHQYDVAHGDLCPSNGSSQFLITLIVVLINLTSENDYDSQKIHIADFGIALVSQLANPKGGYTTVSGCIEYMAPEIYHHKNINPTPMSDMWTVGIIGYEMCLGEEVNWTTENFQEIKNYMLTSQPLNLWRIPARFSSTIRQIISTCMAFNPTQRFTAAGLSSFIRNNFIIMNADISKTSQKFSFMSSEWS